MPSETGLVRSGRIMRAHGCRQWQPAFEIALTDAARAQVDHGVDEIIEIGARNACARRGSGGLESGERQPSDIARVAAFGDVGEWQRLGDECRRVSKTGAWHLAIDAVDEFARAQVGQN